MNKTFSDEVKRDVGIAQNGFCRKDGCLEHIHSYHHRLPNDKANRKKFHLFCQSPMNCTGLCLNHHANNDYEFKITENEAAVYEEWLENLSGSIGRN